MSVVIMMTITLGGPEGKVFDTSRNGRDDGYKMKLDIRMVMVMMTI